MNKGLSITILFLTGFSVNFSEGLTKKKLVCKKLNVKKLALINRLNVKNNLQARNIKVKKLTTTQDLTVARNLVTKNLDVRNAAIIKALTVSTNLKTKNLEVTNSAKTLDLTVTRNATISSLAVSSNGQISGNLTVNGTLTTAGLVSNPSNYLSIQKFTNQAITTTFTNVSGFTNINSEGWTINGSGDTFTAPTTGTYKITYNGIIESPVVATATPIFMRMLVNGSLTSGSVVATNNLVLVASVQEIGQTWIANLTAGDTLNLQIANTTTTVVGLQLSSFTTGSTTSAASSIMIVPAK